MCGRRLGLVGAAIRWRRPSVGAGVAAAPGTPQPWSACRPARWTAGWGPVYRLPTGRSLGEPQRSAGPDRAGRRAGDEVAASRCWRPARPGKASAFGSGTLATTAARSSAACKSGFESRRSDFGSHRSAWCGAAPPDRSSWVARPAGTATTLFTTAWAIVSRNSATALPTCGVSTTLDMVGSDGSTRGSCS